MAEIAAALLDTSVVIDFGSIDHAQLPGQLSVSTITLAELAAGPHEARTSVERARRQSHLQYVERAFATLPFDDASARAYGRIYAAAAVLNRSSRRRFADYLIAATALANELPLYTRNAPDFAGFEELIDLRSV